MKKKNNNNLIDSIKRLNNVIIGLVIAMIVLVVAFMNKSTLNEVFDNSSKKATITPYSKVSVHSADLRNEVGTFFKSISTLPTPSISEEKIELGQTLFFDKRLSKDGTISCNSCHNLKTFGVDNLATSPGDTKEFGDRNSPTVIYSSLHAMQFWDGRAKDVEEQAGMPILNPIEHNIPSEEYLVERLKGIEEYQQLFSAAFPDEKDPITYNNLTHAIGAFERMLNPVSAFDKWLDGDDDAISEEAKAGVKSFVDNGCVTCHSGVAIGGQMLQKFGVYGDYWDYTRSKNIDLGRYEVTKDENDKYVFKAPSLRNIEMTHPYFHDGSVEKLEDAIKIMSILQNNKHLSDKETQQIIAFLKTLTAPVDERFIP